MMKPKDLLNECDHEWLITDAAFKDGEKQYFAMALCKHCRFKISVDEAINIQLYKHIAGKEFKWSILATSVSFVAIVISFITLLVQIFKD